MEKNKFIILEHDLFGIKDIFSLEDTRKEKHGLSSFIKILCPKCKADSLGYSCGTVIPSIISERVKNGKEKLHKYRLSLEYFEDNQWKKQKVDYDYDEAFYCKCGFYSLFSGFKLKKRDVYGLFTEHDIDKLKKESEEKIKNKVESLDKIIHEKENKIKTLQNLIKEKDEKIESLKKLVMEKDEKIISLENINKENIKEIEKLKQTINNNDKIMNSCNQFSNININNNMSNNMLNNNIKFNNNMNNNIQFSNNNNLQFNNNVNNNMFNNNMNNNMFDNNLQFNNRIQFNNNILNNNMQFNNNMKNNNFIIDNQTNNIQNFQNNKFQDMNYNTKQLNMISKTQMKCVTFISSDNQLVYGIPCSGENIFAEIEEKLYQEFPIYRETNNNFYSNGKEILRFKSINDNNIGNGKPILLVRPNKS